jgi:hypothetical protein
MENETSNIVTWQQAEDALMAAIEYGRALPDRERALLAAGRGLRMSGWPDVVRDLLRDHPDEVPVASPSMTRRMLAHYNRMFIDKGYWAEAIAIEEAKLVITAATSAMAHGGRVQWSAVYRRLGERKFSSKLFKHLVGQGMDEAEAREAAVIKTTTDAMRKAYEREIRELAKRLTETGYRVGRMGV